MPAHLHGLVTVTIQQWFVHTVKARESTETCEQVNGIQYSGITASYTATLQKDIFYRGYIGCMCPFAIATAKRGSRLSRSHFSCFTLQ
jgi:hypothetical protein